MTSDKILAIIDERIDKLRRNVEEDQHVITALEHVREIIRGTVEPAPHLSLGDTEEAVPMRNRRDHGTASSQSEEETERADRNRKDKADREEKLPAIKTRVSTDMKRLEVARLIKKHGPKKRTYLAKVLQVPYQTLYDRTKDHPWFELQEDSTLHLTTEGWQAVDVEYDQ